MKVNHMNDQTIEQEIVARGANVAPRITPADIEANIAGAYYFTAYDGAYHDGPSAYYPADRPHAEELGLLTFCVLVLRNGFTVTGESVCVSPENFNTKIGRSVARANAVQKIWSLMGYELKQRLNQ